MKNIFLRSCY